MDDSQELCRVDPREKRPDQTPRTSPTGSPYLCEEASAVGTHSSQLTCDVGRKEREAVLGRLREGTIRTIVSSRVLNEGLDVPEAEVAIVTGGTLGDGEHVQRVGRLLRPLAGKRALVYELVTRGTFEEKQAARRGRRLVSRVAPQV